MKEAHNSPSSDAVAQRGRALAKAGVLLLLTASIGLSIALAAASATASDYTARSVVLVTPLEGNPFNPTGNGDDLNNLQSEAQLAQSDAVADRVSVPGGVAAARLTVKVPPNTQLLEFSYQAPDQEAARAGADGFARAFLQFRTSRADQAVVSRSRKIQDEIDAQSARINALAAQKRGARSPEERAAIQEQMNGITAQVVQLSTTLSAVTTIDRDPGQIVTLGHLTGRSPQTNRVLYAVAGLVLGLGAGLLLLALAGRRTRRDDAASSEAEESSRLTVAESPRSRTTSPKGASVADKKLAAGGNPQ